MAACERWARPKRLALRQGLVAAAASCLLLQSGCSSVFEPYPQLELSDKRPKFLENDTTTLAGDLPAALDYADEARQALYDRVDDQAKLRNGLALALVPVGATALFLGITGSSNAIQDVIAGLGIGGAALFGLGSFYTDRQKDLIWIAGSEAIGCAQLAASPMLIRKEDYARFEMALLGSSSEQLSAAQKDLEESIGALLASGERVRTALAGFSLPENRAELTGQLAESDARQLNARKSRAEQQVRNINWTLADLQRALGAEEPEQATIENLKERLSLQTSSLNTTIGSLTTELTGIASVGMSAGLIGKTAAGAEDELQKAIENVQSKLDDFKGRLGALETAQSLSLDQRIADVSAAIATLEVALAETDASISSRARTESARTIADAQTVLAQAIETRRNGYRLRGDLQQAAILLVTHVDRILDEVSKQIALSQPDLAQIAGMVQGLQANAGIFAGVPLAPRSVTTDSDGELGRLEAFEGTADQRVAVAGAELRATVRDLQHASAIVAGVVTDVSARSENVGRFEDCNLGAIESGFSISPDVSSIELGKNETFVFGVTVDTGMPTAQFIGVTPTGLGADVALENGSFVAKVTADDKATAGTTGTLRIASGSGRSEKRIAVRVKAVQEQVQTNGEQEDNQQDLTQHEQAINNTPRMGQIQRLLAMSGEGREAWDCKIGDVTRGKLQAWFDHYAGELEEWGLTDQNQTRISDAVERQIAAAPMPGARGGGADDTRQYGCAPGVNQPNRLPLTTSGEPTPATPSPETGDAGTGDAGTDDGGTDDAGTDDGGTDDAGTDDGGTDDAGTDDGGTDDGGTGAATPGPGELSEAQIQTFEISVKDNTALFKALMEEVGHPDASDYTDEVRAAFKERSSAPNKPITDLPEGLADRLSPQLMKDFLDESLHQQVDELAKRL